jgi:hypothetical protein
MGFDAMASEIHGHIDGIVKKFVHRVIGKELIEPFA